MEAIAFYSYRNKIIKKVELNASPCRPDVEPGLTAATAILDPPGGAPVPVEALHPHLEVPTTSLHWIRHRSRSPPPNLPRIKLAATGHATNGGRCRWIRPLAATSPSPPLLGRQHLPSSYEWCSLWGIRSRCREGEPYARGVS